MITRGSHRRITLLRQVTVCGWLKDRYVTSQLAWSTQPGHPSVARQNEYQWKLWSRPINRHIMRSVSEVSRSVSCIWCLAEGWLLRKRDYIYVMLCYVIFYITLIIRRLEYARLPATCNLQQNIQCNLGLCESRSSAILPITLPL